MAIDYNTDILPLFVTKVVTDEPYASVPAVLQDDEPERRILTTIEVIRSHMSLIESRTEAKLLQMVLSSLMEKVGSGGFVYTPEQLIVLGNFCNPTFPAGASLDITLDGTTVSPVSATGGDLDTVVSELNASLAAASSAETSDVTPIDDTPNGFLSGKHFFISDPTDDYYVWMSPNAAVGQVIDVDVDAATLIGGGERFHISSPTIDYYTWYDKRRAEISSFNTVADVAGSLGGTSFLLNGINAAPNGVPKAFYVWYDVPFKEVTDIIVSADVAGSLGGKHWLINSALDATAYYVWYDVTARAEVTDATAVADIAGSLGGTHWLINSALDAKAYYVWYDVTARAEVTDIDVVGDVEGSLGGTHWLLNSPSTAYYVWYDFAAAAEVTEITVAADVEGSLGGTHWLINSAGDATAYYVWYDFAAVAEVTDITVFGDSDGSLGGTSWLLNSANDATPYHVWYDVTARAEVSDVTTVADVAGSLNSTFFRIDSPTTPYYVWYDVSSGGVDPSGANPGRTPITVAITTGDTAAVVATATRAAVGGVADFGTGGAGAIVTITNAAVGSVPDAVDGSAATGFGFSITTQGITASVDPANTANPITVGIAGESTDTVVAEATFAAITAIGDFGAVDAGAVVTVTNAATGFTTDASDVTAEVAVSVTTQGSATQADPAPGGTPITVTIVTNDSNTSVANATQAAIDGVGDFGASVLGAVVTVTNAATGFTTDATNVDAEVVVSVTTEGSATQADPAPGGTPITVTILPDDSSTFVAEKTFAAIDGVGDFGAVDDGEQTVSVTNAAVGAVTDASEVDAGVTVDVTTQGITASVDPAATANPITVGIAGDSADTVVATATRVAVGANPDFIGGGAGATATITHAAVGAATDAVDVDTGFLGVTVTTQGITASVDPAATANPITVGIAGDATADSVAEATSAAVDGIGDFGAVDSGGVVTVTNAVTGTTTDASVGTSEFTVETTTQGTTASTDPASAANSITVLLATGDGSFAVAEKTTNAIAGEAEFGAAHPGENTVTVTNTFGGAVTDISDVDSGFSEFAATTQGLGANTDDPAPAGRTEIKVTIGSVDSADTVAAATEAAVGGFGDFTTSDSEETVTITNTVGGVVLSPFDSSTSEFSPTTIIIPGAGPGGTDPGPFAGRTTVTVSYTPGDVASEIAFNISGALDGLGDFAAEVSGSTVEITNAESGDAIPDISAETSGFFVEVTAQGTGTSAVELFKTAAGKIGVRNTVGAENVSFTIADGSGGILAPAGMLIGDVFARPEVVAAASIDDAIGSYVAAPRDASL